MSERLKTRRIERKPKEVVRHRGWYRKPDQLTARQRSDFSTIVERLSRGTSIEEFYRRDIDKDHDELLAREGILHLHFGGKGSDVLLYLIQYPTDIVLLCIDTHVHLDESPPGKRLLNLAREADQMAIESFLHAQEQRSKRTASLAKFRDSIRKKIEYDTLNQ